MWTRNRSSHQNVTCAVVAQSVMGGQCLWLVTWLQLQCYDDYRLVVVVTAEVLQK